MARDRANIRTDMWGDEDFTSLGPGAQLLYVYLLAFPKLTYAGTADWRPKQIAQKMRGVTPAQVCTWAAELEQARFVVIDEETEEIFIRSFLRHDGALQNPNLWKSIGRDFAGIGSKKLSARVGQEVRRLRDAGIDTQWKSLPWDSPYLQTLLKAGSDTPHHTQSDTPSGTGSGTPSDSGSDTSTSTSTSTNASHSGRARSIPSSWAPTAEHINYAKEHRLDVVAEADAFRLHAEANGRTLVNWNAGFSQWIRKAKPTHASAASHARPVRKEFQAYPDEVAS